MTRATVRKAQVTKAGQKRVSAKISHLHKAEPGMSHEQQVAVALNMEREHRLTSAGGYKPVKKAKPAKRKA